MYVTIHAYIDSHASHEDHVAAKDIVPEDREIVHTPHQGLAVDAPGCERLKESRADDHA